MDLLQQILPCNRLVIVLILMMVAPLTTSFLPLYSSSEAQSVNSGTTNVNRLVEVFQPDSQPFGLSYADWTAKWWQWAYSIPKDVNPSYDDTGRYCAEGQSGPVWFLTGTYSHPVDRYCTIPAGKAILFTILNSECSFAEFPDLRTERELRQCAKQMQDSVVHLEASIDGIPLTGLEKYRIQSPLFNFTIPENNILGLPPQTTGAVSDGNWVFLKPLPVGNHTIYFKGGLRNITDGSNNHAFAGPYGWDYPNTYHITVVDNGASAQSISGGLSPSSVNENTTIGVRTGNITNMTSGGLSAASVGNETVISDRIDNTSGSTFGGLYSESVRE
jgi:hypothetical protein